MRKVDSYFSIGLQCLQPPTRYSPKNHQAYQIISDEPEYECIECCNLSPWMVRNVSG